MLFVYSIQHHRVSVSVVVTPNNFDRCLCLEAGTRSHAWVDEGHFSSSRSLSGDQKLNLSRPPHVHLSHLCSAHSAWASLPDGQGVGWDDPRGGIVDGTLHGHLYLDRPAVAFVVIAWKRHIRPMASSSLMGTTFSVSNVVCEVHNPSNQTMFKLRKKISADLESVVVMFVLLMDLGIHSSLVPWVWVSLQFQDVHAHGAHATSSDATALARTLQLTYDGWRPSFSTAV